MFGKRIVELRKKKGVTQEELSNAIGISRSALSLYEIEKREPDIDTLNKLATVFNVPVDYILGTGAFENWNELIKLKDSVLSQISHSLTRLSSSILSDMDEISFAKLVYAFDIKIVKHNDGTYGITTKDPIPTYSSNIFPESKPIEADEAKLLAVYRCLSEEEKAIVYGKALDLKYSSVAADEQERKAVGK